MTLDSRAPATATAGAARSGSAAGVGGALGVTLAPYLGLDPVAGAALVGGILTAIGSAFGKVARDKVNAGFPNAFWSLVAALL